MAELCTPVYNSRKATQLRTTSQTENTEIKTIDGVPVRTLFVANLPPNVSECVVANKFSIFGPVVKTSIVHNTKHQKKTTFGFVTYKNPLDAAKVLRMHKISLNSQRLYVSTGDSWHQPVETASGTLIWCNRTKKEPVETEDEESEEEISVEDNENCPILGLNDDCLLMIFSYIPLIERVALGSVCRRWRNFTNVMWCSIKDLNLTKPPTSNVILTPEIFEFLMKKCINLTSINLCNVGGHQLNSSSIATIATRFKMLEDLSFCKIDLYNRSLALLARSCPNLKSIYIEACTNCHDGEITSLIEKCPNLEKISIKYNTHLNKGGTWLRHLREPLKHLSLHKYYFNPEYLIQGLRKVQRTMRELSITACNKIRQLDLYSITEAAPDLRVLELTGLHPVFEVRGLTKLAGLENLTHLNLENYPFVGNDLVIVLLDRCPHIQSISLAGNDNILLTREGLVLLGNFPELTHLNLSYIFKLTDDILKSIAQKATNLKRLDLIGCITITDEGCSSVISLCSSLEVLDISGCDQLTSASVYVAIEYASMGIKKNKLTMIVGDSGVDLDVNWDSPYIVIDKKSNDLSAQNEEALVLDEEMFPAEGLYDMLHCIGLDYEGAHYSDYVTSDDSDLDSYDSLEIF